MDFYDIISLVVFWKKQEEKDFEAIKSVLDIINDPNVQEEEMGELIILELRRNGLYEVDFGSPPNEDMEGMEILDDEKPEQDEIEWNNDDNVDVPIEIYKIKVLNCFIHFNRYLN